MCSIKLIHVISSILLLIFIHLVSTITEYSDEVLLEGTVDINSIDIENSTIPSDYELTDSTTETTTDGITSSTARSTTTTRKPTTPSTTRRPHRTTNSVITTSENISCIPVVTDTGLSSTTPSKVEIRCSADNGSHGIEYWPPVLIGDQSEVKCLDGDGVLRWKCLDSGEFDPEGPDYSNCTDWVDGLDNIPDIEYISQAIKLIEFISNKTEKNDTIKQSDKLSKVLNVISKVQDYVNSANDTDLGKLYIYSSTIVETFTHIMDQKQAWVNSTANEKTILASKILIGTQSSSYALSLQQNSTENFVEIKNNDFYINTFYTDSSQGLIFPNKKKNFSTIFIPPNTMFVNSTLERNSTAIGAIISNLNGYMTANLEEYHEINSDILSFSLTNSSERILLNQDVKITLKHKHRLQFGDTVDCVFWDFNQTKWSSEGCYKLSNESDLLLTVCKCNHLTNFAALMDVHGRESKTLLKSLLTYFCSIISIIGLMFTINLIVRSKHNSQNDSFSGSLNEMRSIITCNLCICLMITNLLVIAGMDRTDILWLCQMSSALLLYSLLSSFSWMLMEGYYLYKSLVCIFKTEYKASYLYFLGYGLPIAIFIIAFLIIYIKENILLEALFDERYNYFCWISSSYYPSHIWILIGPAVCVTVCNCILMFISLRTAYKILRSQSSFGVNTDKTKIKFRQIISFVFILFLLGITWLSFLFYIHQLFTAFFAYVFIVLNGSQGFFIFLYHLSIFDFKGNRRADSVNSSKSNLVI